LTIDESGNQDIYILDPDRGNMLKLTDNANIDRWPLWTQDGQRIVFLSVREEGIGIYAKAANGLGKVEKLAGWSEPYLPGPFAWVKDGNTLLSWDLNLSSRQTSISIMQMEGGLTRKPLFEDEKYNYDHPQISPDGRWLAYSSSKSGQNEVYVCSYPDVERDQKMISVSGGYGPLWSTDGQEVFYRNGQSVMACPVETDSILKPGKPRELFRGSYNYELVSSQAILPAWGFHPIEKRFLMIKPSHTSSDRSRIIIVVNWFEELKQRVSVD
jgi:Tol biopolymer transport system component